MAVALRRVGMRSSWQMAPWLTIAIAPSVDLILIVPNLVEGLVLGPPWRTIVWGIHAWREEGGLAALEATCTSMTMTPRRARAPPVVVETVYVNYVLIPTFSTHSGYFSESMVL